MGTGVDEGGEPPARDAESAWRSLAYVERSPEGAAGAWSFGAGVSGGMLFVESGRVCWVVAHGLRRRLTNLLVAQSAAAPDAIAEVVRGCRTSGTPLGEALVAAGLVTPAGLRRALREHSAACLLRIDPDQPAQFVVSQRRYDAALTFSGTEIMDQACRALAGNGANTPVALLDRALRGGGSGVALATPVGKAVHPVALKGMDEWTHGRLQQLGDRIGDVIPPVGRGGAVEVGTFKLEGHGAIGWRLGGVAFVLLVAKADTLPVRVAGVKGMLGSLGVATG